MRKDLKFVDQTEDLLNMVDRLISVGDLQAALVVENYRRYLNRTYKDSR